MERTMETVAGSEAAGENSARSTSESGIDTEPRKR